jgi:hypothetical protein
MSTAKARQPRGIPVGGQFAGTSHGEAGLTLTATRLAALEPFGHIPAPREGQAFADGSPVPAGSSFEEAYREFFRTLDEHEAEHDEYTPQPGPSEGELLKLAGLQNVNLGRERGTSMEVDDDGEPVFVVHTRNGGYYADCYADNEDDCNGTCNGCIQSDVIPNLPTFIRVEHESGDSDNYFRAADPEAARAVLAATRKQEGLHLRNYLRQAISEGKAAPWDILAQVHGEAVPYSLLQKRSKAIQDERNHARYAQLAGPVLEAVRNGTEAPTFGTMMREPVGQFKYDVAVKQRDRAQAEADEARAAEAALKAELEVSLPPTVKALATAELDRLSGAAAKAEERVEAEVAKIRAVAPHLEAWANRTSEETAEYAARVKKASDDVESFDWARSWPGELADCPLKPSAE